MIALLLPGDVKGRKKASGKLLDGLEYLTQSILKFSLVFVATGPPLLKTSSLVHSFADSACAPNQVTTF